MNPIQNAGSKSRPRLTYIDNLRVFACFLVLLTHSTMHTVNPEEEGKWMALISLIGSPSSELFLALSGTVLLPVKTGFKKFYKRRFLKLIPPLIIWSILGTIRNVYSLNMSWDDALDRILHIPVAPAIGVYWFVYAMIGLYLLAPFVSPWLKTCSKRQIELFLLLWGINMIIPWFLYFIPDLFPVNSQNFSFYEQGNY